MRYTLRPGLSFCEVEGRLLFLDLIGDRYFCLAPAAEAAFVRLYRDAAAEDTDQARLIHLAAAGLLVASDHAAGVAPCVPPSMAVRSLIDDARPWSGAPARAAAMIRLTLARIELRIAGMARTALRVARRKERAAGNADRDRIAEIAAAFEASKALVTAHDLCLPRSLAIAHALLAVGARPDLVLGVRLAPFRAHAWVQWGDLLVNERIEVARLFTPILVL